MTFFKALECRKHHSKKWENSLNLNICNLLGRCLVSKKKSMMKQIQIILLHHTVLTTAFLRALFPTLVVWCHQERPRNPHLLHNQTCLRTLKAMYFPNLKETNQKKTTMPATVQIYMHLNNSKKVVLVTVANKTTMQGYYWEPLKKWNHSNVLRSIKKYKKNKDSSNKTVIKTIWKTLDTLEAQELVSFPKVTIRFRRLNRSSNNNRTNMNNNHLFVTCLIRIIIHFLRNRGKWSTHNNLNK